MILNSIYKEDIFSILFTDFYHLTTSQIYFLQNRQNEKAIFYSYIRKNYPNNNYTIFSGISLIIEFIKELKKNPLKKSHLDYLKNIGFDENFCIFLSSLKFDVKIYSIRENSPFFPQQPILKVVGSIIECKILEPLILNILNSHCGYATHAYRVNYAINYNFNNGSLSGIASVQGLRRGLSIGNSIESSYTLKKHGYVSTSTVLESYLSNSKPIGTMDHAWIMSHENEIDAFRSYSNIYKNNGVFLVDTYNIKNGIENAITVLKELRSGGHGKNYGIRIDSNDVVRWSFYALRRFFEEKLIENDKSLNEINSMSDLELLFLSSKINHDLFCCASDNLDERKIFEMRKNGCFIKFWGIGTSGSIIPPLGIVYKISQLNEKKLIKLSGKNYEKSSLPGDLNSRYLLDSNKKICGIFIYDNEKYDINKKEAIDFFAGKKVNINYQLSNETLISIENMKENSMENSFDTISHNLLDFNDIKQSIILIDVDLWNNFQSIKNSIN